MPKHGEDTNNFHKQLPVPFVIHADFEAITKKVQGCKQSEEMEKEKEKRSYTEAYQTHEDCGHGYKVVCCYKKKYSKPLFTNSWKICSKRLNTAKVLLRKGSTNH